MTHSQLLKLQELLVDDICWLALYISKMTPSNYPSTERERRCSHLFRNLANRRLQLECVNDLLHGRPLRHQMPIDWR